MENKLDPIRFGLALGATCFLGALFLGVVATYFGYGVVIVELAGTVYRGYGPTILGSFFGAGWAMADGFIGGWLFAYFYNKF